MNQPANLGMNILLIGARRLSSLPQGFTTEEKTLEETPGPQSKLNQGATVKERECITSTTVKSNTVNRRNDEKPQRSAENNQISSNKTFKTTPFYFLVLNLRQQCSRSCSAFAVQEVDCWSNKNTFHICQY